MTVKLLRWIVLPPIVLLVMALAVANRGSVTFSLDPFDSISPSIGLEVPLFLIVLISVLVGILIGGMGAWTQAKRKAARSKASLPETNGLPVLRE